MVRHSFAPVVLLLTALNLLFLQTHCSPLASQQKRGICGTEHPDPAFLDAVHNVRVDESNSNTTDSEARNGPIEIETWFHIISSKAEAGQVSDDMINSQLSILQSSYQDAGIRYRLAGITRHVNDAWAHDTDDIGMKTALRKGTYKTLNVYFQTNLEAAPGQSGRTSSRANSASDDLSASVLGFCTLPDPSINANSPRSAYVKDGCNVLAQTMPGGTLDLYNRGGTAIHEIGHWNGLLHTFQGESCDESNPGDYIDDTPQQSSPTGGCPARRDSCPDLPGEDLVHDFMDYSSDVCYESFTGGQIRRMRSMWGSMRRGK
ncbi:hypothetical protein N7481_006518 [Penicillium waksmanii]|uniref:uncharacterized protein n=1 Tax=Penicillium waksmanii TaxID=69791 RepID=UPI00254685EF|nr:uncharacterized protein N7481_006518 [Penicillium waksmanii]KAJ5984419.1 hypothetical protein N7481_006518 [Penicillium waksmanii]